MKERNCFNCEHHRLCFLYQKISDALSGVYMLNINNPDTSPGNTMDIIDALAKACIEYKEKNND